MSMYLFPVPCALDDEVEVVREGQSAAPAQTMELSDDYLRMRFGEPLDPGTPIKINIDFWTEEHVAEHLEAEAEVLNRFREPESDLWQVGVKIKYRSPAHQQHWETHLSSCRGVF